MRLPSCLLFLSCTNIISSSEQLCHMGITNTHTNTHLCMRTKYEDIPGMLLFDSNLLCVDGLVDADCLCGRRHKWETNQSIHFPKLSSLSISDYDTLVFFQKSALPFLMRKWEAVKIKWRWLTYFLLSWYSRQQLRGPLSSLLHSMIMLG